MAGVTYVDRAGSTTSKFTDRLAAAVQSIERQGAEIVAVVPNGGLSETLGVWIFFRTRAG